MAIRSIATTPNGILQCCGASYSRGGVARASGWRRVRFRDEMSGVGEEGWLKGPDDAVVAGREVGKSDRAGRDRFLAEIATRDERDRYERLVGTDAVDTAMQKSKFLGRLYRSWLSGDGDRRFPRKLGRNHYEILAHESEVHEAILKLWKDSESSGSLDQTAAAVVGTAGQVSQSKRQRLDDLLCPRGIQGNTVAPVQVPTLPPAAAPDPMDDSPT